MKTLADEAEEAYEEFRQARPDAGPALYCRPTFVAAYIAGYEARKGLPYDEEDLTRL